MNRLTVSIPLLKGYQGEVFSAPTEDTVYQAMWQGFISFHVGIRGDTDIDSPDDLLKYSQDAILENPALTTRVSFKDLDLRIIRLYDKDESYYIAECEVSSAPFIGLDLKCVTAFAPMYFREAKLHGNLVVFIIEVPAVALN